MAKKKYIIGAGVSKERLDRFLTTELGQTRSQVQKLIKGGFVRVNDEVPSVHHWLKAGDSVQVTLEAKKKVAPPPPPPLKIIDETPDFLVVYKPAGVLTHAAPNGSAPVLTVALVKKYPSIKKVGDPSRPGIVHRLDRDVSGLLVVAKTKAMYEHLVSQFKARQVKKIYTGLVEGKIDVPDGVLDFVIARSKTNRGQMAARPKGQEGRPAETRYTVVKRWAHVTLLELELITGRTHQIRAHLKAFRRPLVGDPIYGAKVPTAVPFRRPFLQATALSFVDRQGERHEYQIPLDGELQSFLSSL